MRKDTGKLIIFEGVDGVGKSTLLKQTYDMLRSKGYNKVIKFKNIEEGSVTGNAIRRILDIRRSEYVDSLRIALLYTSELFYVFNKKDGINDYLKKGYIVLLDRSIYSTYAYAGDKDSTLDFLDNIKKELPEEDLLVYTDANISSIMKRLNKGKKDLYESEDKVKKHLRAYNQLFIRRVDFFGGNAVPLDNEFLYIGNSNDGNKPLPKVLPGTLEIYNKIILILKGENYGRIESSENDYFRTIRVEFKVLWGKLLNRWKGRKNR